MGSRPGPHSLHIFPQQAFGLTLCDTLEEDLVVGDLFYDYRDDVSSQEERHKEALYVYDLGDFFAHKLTLQDKEELPSTA